MSLGLSGKIYSGLQGPEGSPAVHVGGCSEKKIALLVRKNMQESVGGRRYVSYHHIYVFIHQR